MTPQFRGAAKTFPSLVDRHSLQTYSALCLRANILHTFGIMTDILLRKFLSLPLDSLVGPVVKSSASRTPDSGLTPAFSVGIFQGRGIPVTETLALHWLPCQHWH